ncbi:MAG: hypothetical protein K1X65_05300 [Caldilineales bacterium]|nr:hypothetical protein [Caldilineales bacterium]MCW5858896.1 hypothetical protein [Caldilineales bacterium]
MHTLLGVSLYILHGLGRHRLLGATLSRWLLVVLFLGAGLAWIGWIPGGVALAGLLAAAAILLIAGQNRAQKRFYVSFSPEAAAAPTPSPLPPADKLPTLATGLFAVDERTAAFTNLAAFYRTYPTREHAILARKTPTRFLGLGEADPTLVGMWYIFVAPAALTGVQAGTIGFGRSQRPGLRIDYVRKNKKDQPVVASAYLGFEDASERERAWADLLVESGRGEAAE